MTIRVQGPDGRLFEFPDGVSSDEMSTALQKVYGTPRIDELRAKYPEGERAGFIQRAAQSALFNFGDEIVGGIKGAQALFTDQTVGDAYRQGRDKVRDKLELYQLEHPGRAMAADIIGGLAPVGPSIAARGVSLGARVARGVATGLGYGAASGFGEGQGSGDRLAGAGIGAAAGGALGAAVPLASAGVGAVAGGVADAVRGRVSPRSFATSKVSEAMTDAGLSPASAAARIGRVASDTGQKMSLADFGGESTRRLLRTASNVPGPAQNAIATKLTLRDMGQADRIKGILSGTLKDPAQFGQTVDDIVARRQSQATPFYEKAKATPIPYTSSLEELLSRPAGRSALARAKTIAANEGIPFQQLFGEVDDAGNIVNVKRVTDMRAWDYIKRALDGMIEEDAAVYSPFGHRKLSPNGRAIAGIREKMLSEIDAANPAYAQARRVALDNIRAQGALDLGRKAFTMTEEQFRRQFSVRNDSERELVQMGLAEAIRDQVDRGGLTHNVLNRFANDKTKRGIIRAAFDDNATDYGKFMRGVINEARMRRTFDKSRGNSTTAAQMADMMNAGALREGAPVLSEAVQGRPVHALINFIGSRMRMLGGFTPEVANEVQKILLQTDPSRVRRLAADLSRISNSRAKGADMRAALVNAIVGATSIQADELKPARD